MKPKLFLRSGNTRIYYAYKNGYGKGREMNYHYSTRVQPEAEHYEHIFDIRDLGFPQASREDWEPNGEYDPNWQDAYRQKVRAFLEKAIKEGKLKR